MLKQILIVLSVLTSLTLVAHAAPEKTVFDTKLTRDGDSVGYARYAEQRLSEEKSAQHLFVEFKTKPEKVLVVSIDGEEFAKVKSDSDGFAVLKMQGTRIHSGKSDIPVVKKGSVIKISDGAYGYFKAY